MCLLLCRFFCFARTHVHTFRFAVRVGVCLIIIIIIARPLSLSLASSEGERMRDDSADDREEHTTVCPAERSSFSNIFHFSSGFRPSTAARIFTHIHTDTYLQVRLARGKARESHGDGQDGSYHRDTQPEREKGPGTDRWLLQGRRRGGSVEVKE